MYEINKLPQMIDIGYTGEHTFRTIEIDMSAWMELMPTGVPSIVHIRPGESPAEAYVAATTFEDNILSWTISASDLGDNEGTGLAQVWLEETSNPSPNKTGMSNVFATLVRQSVSDGETEAPAAQVPWLQQMTALKTETVAANVSAVAAKDVAVSAQENAEAALTATEAVRDIAISAKEDAEAYAIGTRDGADVDSDDPAYHNNSKYYAAQASASAITAENAKTDAVSAKNSAQTYSNAASNANSNAQSAKTAAQTAASNAQTYANNANSSKNSAQTYANNAQSAATTATTAKNNAQTSANNANTYKNNAASSATSASNSATAASGSASSASSSALKSEGYALGKQNGTPVGSSSTYYHNNSEYFAGQASDSADSSAGSASAAAADALVSEGYATGKQNGVDVGDTSPYYHNNTAYFYGETKDVYDSIPSDYSTLSDDVDNLKSAFDDLFDPNGVVKTVGKTSDVFTAYSTAGYVGYSDGLFSSSASNQTYLFDVKHDTDIYLSDISRLVTLVIYNQHLSTLPTTSGTASQYYVKGARSDKTGDYALPTSESKWHVTAGQMVAITAQTAPVGGFSFTYTDYTLLNEQIVGNLETVMGTKKPIIKYLSTVDTQVGSRGKEQISVFLPTVSGYIKYAFVRCEYDPYNCNVWRIDDCYACSDSLIPLFNITHGGEWEMAIKIDGARDFIGGNAHGDEVMTAFHVLIDGVEISDITTITERNFETVRIVETSLMYNPEDQATLSTRGQFTPVGTHGREYIITRDGVRLTQEVTLDTALTLSASYMTMFPIIRGNDAVSAEQITDHYYADNNYTEYDVSVGGSGEGYGWKQNVTRATIWGNTSGISATVEMLKQPDINNLGARRFQVQDTVDYYNKLYWSICGVAGYNYDASANERFVTDTMYRISAK